MRKMDSSEICFAPQLVETILVILSLPQQLIVI